MERLELSRNTCSVVTFGCVGTLQSASHTVGEGLRDKATASGKMVGNSLLPFQKEWFMSLFFS